MTETISIDIESEDLKEFQETTGMSLTGFVKILVNRVKIEMDTSCREENLQHLKKIIDDMNHGRNMARRDSI